jgi:hypothetical protein
MLPIEIQKCSYNSFIFIQTAKATGWYLVMIFFSSIMKDEASNVDNINDLVSINHLYYLHLIEWIPNHLY